MILYFIFFIFGPKSLRRSPRAAQPSPSSGLLEARQRRVREERPQLAGCGPAAGRSENRAASRPERLKPAPLALRAKNKNKNKKSSAISNLQSPISSVVFCRIQSDLRSPSPISNLQSRFGGAGEGGGLEPSRRCAMDSFTPHISDLRSPISHLTPAAASCDLQSPISISNLRPGGGCPARGSTICVLHLQSPPLTLATANTIHNL